MDIETGEPLLCVSGKDTRIKILNIATGLLVKVSVYLNIIFLITDERLQTLHGHGHVRLAGITTTIHI